jgi:hypothetical protein
LPVTDIHIGRLGRDLLIEGRLIVK